MTKIRRWLLERARECLGWVIFVLLGVPAWAGPVAGIQAGVRSISVAVSGTEGGEARFSGMSLPEIRAEWKWVRDEGQEQIKFQIDAARFQLESASRSLMDNGQFFFGSGLSWGRFFSFGHVSAGLMFAQSPLLESITLNVWNLTKNLVFSVPLQFKTKLVVLEHESIQAGMVLSPVFWGITRSASGYSAGAFLEYERKTTRGWGVRLSYDVQDTNLASTSQSEVSLGLAIRMSLNDEDSVVPLDEIE